MFVSLPLLRFGDLYTTSFTYIDRCRKKNQRCFNVENSLEISPLDNSIISKL